MEPGILIGIIGLVVGLISLFLTYLFYKKSLRLKLPLFAVESRGFIGGLPDELPKLSLSYDNEQIDYFTSTRIAIWNAGSDTINKADLVDSLTITPEDGYKFLEARIITTIDNLNNFRINFTSKLVTVEFDYIDKDQGCCIEINHTGKTSWALKLDGTIKGAGKFKQAVHLPYPKRKKKAFLLSITSFLVGTGISLLTFGWSDPNIIKKVVGINGITAGLLYGVGPGLISALYVRRNRTSLLLGVFDDDQMLRAPDFPPTGRIRERDKDADPIW